MAAPVETRPSVAEIQITTIPYPLARTTLRITQDFLTTAMQASILREIVADTEREFRHLNRAYLIPQIPPRPIGYALPNQIVGVLGITGTGQEVCLTLQLVATVMERVHSDTAWALTEVGEDPKRFVETDVHCQEYQQMQTVANIIHACGCFPVMPEHGAWLIDPADVPVPSRGRGHDHRRGLLG